MDRTPIHVPSFNDVMDRIAKFDAFSIGGRLYTADMLIPLLTINTKDLLVEASSTPALALYWGLEASRARRFVAETDGQYRVWKERAYMEAKALPLITNVTVPATPKKPEYTKEITKFPTEDQAKATYRLLPEYGEWQRRKYVAQEAAENAEAVYEALKAKKELIKAEIELLRNEAGGAYVVVEDEPRQVPRQPQMASE